MPWGQETPSERENRESRLERIANEVAMRAASQHPAYLWKCEAFTHCDNIDLGLGAYDRPAGLRHAIRIRYPWPITLRADERAARYIADSKARSVVAGLEAKRAA